MIRISPLPVLLSLAIMSSCATPSLRFHQQAEKLGFFHKEYQGTVFKHQVYDNRQPIDQFLHVYLGSDGTPWKTFNRIASDPTPRNPVMLRLMALDTAASVFVGRPCYHAISRTSNCKPIWWTSGRYAEPVVESLGSLLTQVAKEYGTSGIIIFGYSGGGTLSMLLAEQLPIVRGVVTLAGNLDIDAWTAYHGYSPLTESLNPAARPPLREKIFQLHIIGSQDTVVPPHLLEAAIKRQKGSTPIIISELDHQCCWEAVWPGILSRVGQALEEKKIGSSKKRISR